MEGGLCDSPKNVGDKKSIFQRVSKKGMDNADEKPKKSRKILLGGGDLSPEESQLKKMYGVG